MAVGFYTFLCNQYYHHWHCEFDSHSGDTTLCDKVLQWLVADRWFSPPIQLTATIYNRNIVGSGAKHHKPNKLTGLNSPHLCACVRENETWFSIVICCGILYPELSFLLRYTTLLCSVAGTTTLDREWCCGCFVFNDVRGEIVRFVDIVEFHHRLNFLFIKI